jgi:hypothetical protein
VEYNGYQIRLSRGGLDSMAFVTQPKQRPTLIRVPDREAALIEAYEWNKASFASAEDPA